MTIHFKRTALVSILAATVSLTGCHGHPGNGVGSTQTTAAQQPNAQTQAVLNQLAALNPQPIESLSPTAARAQPTFEDAVRILAIKEGKSPVQGVAAVKDITIPGPAGALSARIYKPQSSNAVLPVTVYFHGGGFVLATIDTYDASARAIANAGSTIVISVEYRKAPENKFPAAVDDAYAAYIWATKNAASFGGDTERVAVAGESAGGNLATVVAILARDRGAQLPSYQALIYPVTSANPNTDSATVYANAKPLSRAALTYFLAQYLPSADITSAPLAAPINADLHNLPPATIIAAEIDPLKADGLQYAKKLEKAGVKVDYQRFDGVTHEFFGASAVIDEAAEAQTLVGNDLQLRFNEVAGK